ncbi:MAG: glucose 1-dehydrogenase [Caldilineaceae bacterium]|nr:glucose 1-dehydrogenase [Caldilineaceae bacterium]
MADPLSNPLSSFRLDGKIALITGASRGIGAAIAQSYAAVGATVVLASRKQEGVEAIAATIRAAGGKAHAQPVHTGDDAAVTALVEQTLDRFGGLHILVNNAATNPHFGPILDAEPSHWQKTLDVNVMGYWRMAQACVPSMRAAGGGKIINVASIAGLRSQPGMGIYSVSKAAVIMLTQVLASELAADNIQVNALAPGYVRTRFSQAIWDDPARYAELVQQIPQGRVADSDELIGMALYLAAPVSSFTTGAVLVVDGGQMAR